MSALLCRRILRLNILSTPLPRAFATAASTAALPPSLSSTSSSSPSSSSFTVDFLTTSCGLTPAQALAASRTIRLDEKTCKQRESVLDVLRNHGFSDAQIAGLIARSPRVLLCKAQKKLAPKLQFLSQAGFPTALISQEPAVLLRSLDCHIRPCLEFLRCFISSAEDVCTMFRRHNWCLNFDMKTTMIPNVGLLLDLGLPAPAISKLMVTQPRCLMGSHERFAEAVQMVQDWGLKPDKLLFLHAVRVVCGQRKSTLAARLELFKSLGWSEEEVISAFRSSPLCLLTSEQKITCMNTFAKKLGLGPSDLSRQPKLLMYNLDKRILPRYAVWQILTSKGLIKQRTDKLVSMFVISNKDFIDRYVTRYLDKIPELMDVYLGKIKVEGLELDGMEDRSKQKV